MFVLAMMPVEIVLAGNIGGCNHEAEALSTADMPCHDISDMGPMPMKSNSGCSHGDCHCAACSGANCGVVHPISLMDPSIQYADVGIMHSPSVGLYTSLHSGLFARSLYRPPRS